MNDIKRYLYLLLLAIVTCGYGQDNTSEATRILFIGNSYTYFNSTPQLVEAFVRERSPEQAVETKLISNGGMTLARHWQEESTLETIREGDWDYVVLQEQSKLGMPVVIDGHTYFGNTTLFFEHARKFNAEIKKSGAKTVFLMTWSERDRPTEQAILSHAYTAIAKELKAIVVPVGLAWDTVRTHPELDLYSPDGSHPSPVGSYLYAATLFATLFDTTPLGVSGTISGHRLSNRGVPSADQNVLVRIPEDKAQQIQQASWDVVEAMNTSENYLNFEAPEPGYTIPVLADGETFSLKDITGSWYGTGTYGFNYLGQVLDFKEEEGKTVVCLSFLSPHTRDVMKIEKVDHKDDRLTLTLFDPVRDRNATLEISLAEGKLKGLMTSPGNVCWYNHLNFTRSAIHQGVDLSAMEALMDNFESKTTEEGYVKSAVQHYEAYSKLLGRKYIPEEFYLNAEGYNLLTEEKIEDALNVFALAINYYPHSVNVYDSYAEALVVAGRKEKAIAMYTKAFEMAKKTGYENLGRIENTLQRLINNEDIDAPGPAFPPPPPPPSGGRK
ncbi:DUF4886 domain-containing protein [Robertkochia flava]|uniref:DUF4886 domain-containing protein n=1 Tax=Robertkochia flava TaxID=3447986 RepID=UPI001CCB9168|nr:SGNH/GDSL hydrolase family protein [Robertkochia marina]